MTTTIMNMKEDFDDIEFNRLFKEKAHKPGENPWFTRRVMNRLPDKEKSTGLIPTEAWTYLIGIILCFLCWTFLFNSDYFDVITVRSLIYTCALALGSFLLIIQAIRSAFSY